MHKPLPLLAVALLTACGRVDFPPAAAISHPCEPFVNLERSRASDADKKTLREASEDFCAVVNGQLPRHAKFDEKAGLPSDGGTTFYVGRHYKLTVLNSLSSFGTFSGVAHGPILEFDPAFAPGNTSTFSNVQVYELPASPD